MPVLQRIKQGYQTKFGPGRRTIAYDDRLTNLELAYKDAPLSTKISDTTLKSHGLDPALIREAAGKTTDDLTVGDLFYDLRRDVTQLKDDVTAIKSDVSEHNSRLSSLEERVTALRNSKEYASLSAADKDRLDALAKSNDRFALQRALNRMGLTDEWIRTYLAVEDDIELSHDELVARLIMALSTFEDETRASIDGLTTRMKDCEDQQRKLIGTTSSHGTELDNHDSRIISLENQPRGSLDDDPFMKGVVIAGMFVLVFVTLIVGAAYWFDTNRFWYSMWYGFLIGAIITAAILLLGLLISIARVNKRNKSRKASVQTAQTQQITPVPQAPTHV